MSIESDHDGVRRRRPVPGESIPRNEPDTSHPVSSSASASAPPTASSSATLLSMSSAATKETMTAINESALDGDETEDRNDWSTCPICLSHAQDPVVTLCGHLTCWDCMNEWLSMAPNPACPVCKGLIDIETGLVPIYSSSTSTGKRQATESEEKDPRKKRPPRPRARRVSPPEPVQHAAGLWGGPTTTTTGLQFHAGMFPGMGFSWTFGGGGVPTAYGNESEGIPSDEQRRREMTSGVMILILFVFYVFIVFA